MIIPTTTPDGRSMSFSLGAIMGALEIDTDKPDWQDDAALLVRCMQQITLMGIEDELDKLVVETHRAGFK